MKKQMKTALGLVGVIAAYYLISKGGAMGGGGTIERFGAILGGEGKGGLSPLTSATAAGNMPGAKAAGVAPSYAKYEAQKIFEGKAVGTPSGVIPATYPKGAKVSPITISGAKKQAYISPGGREYVAPEISVTAGRIVGGAYIAPTGLYPKTGGLTAKGEATKKKVAARQASGFVAYSGGQKGTASAQKAAYKARSG